MTHPKKLTHGGAGIGPPICLVSKLEPFIPTARAPSNLCFIGLGGLPAFGRCVADGGGAGGKTWACLGS